MNNLFEDFWEDFFNTLKRVRSHISDFWVIWTLLIAIFTIALLSHNESWVKWAIYILFSLFVLYLIKKPMATVYCLVGSSASIRTFLINFIIITSLFSGIYYTLFFKNAGICYDGDNPVLDYQIFEKKSGVDNIAEKNIVKEVIQEKYKKDSTTIVKEILQTRIEENNYHRITYWVVLKNSFLTSLTQGPSDFFFIISDYGEGMNTCSNNRETTSLFSIILMFHVLISWLFLGVFISLLYSKFRYEA